MKLSQIIGILFLLSCSSNHANQTDLSKNKLKGNIKSVQQFTYKAIEKFGEITKGEITRMSLSYMDNTNIIYNPDGNILEKHTYYVQKDHWSKTYTCEYSMTGELINMSRLNGVGKSIRKIVFNYDNNGNNNEQTEYKVKNEIEIISNKIIYKYNDNRNKIEGNKYISDGTFSKGWIAKYDNKGNILEKKWYKSNKVYYMKQIYQYDEKGNMTEFTKYDEPNGKISFKQTFKYSKNGDPISKSEGIEDTYDETYEYKYDEFNNWVRKVIFINGVPKYIQERDIVYYK